MKKQVFNQGEYTGKIEDKVSINGGIVSRTYYTRNSNPEWHCHENLHIVFVFQNGLSQKKRVDNYTDHKGKAIFFHSGEIHRFLSPAIISKSANVELSEAFLKKYDLTEHEVNYNFSKQQNPKSLLLAMQSELIRKEQNQDQNVLSILLELISEPQTISPSAPRWLSQLEELLHDQWTEDFSLHELSNYLNIHPVTISKYFRKHFGCTLGQYRRKQRIERSIDLIKSSNLSLTEIAHYCGFADQSHFIRTFKEHTHLLPNLYRKL
ncbi:MAG: AraC family transcriptional regulator [Bacteroidota bacterium]